jgi:hypothetical protein
VREKKDGQTQPNSFSPDQANKPPTAAIAVYKTKTGKIPSGEEIDE